MNDKKVLLTGFSPINHSRLADLLSNGGFMVGEVDAITAVEEGGRSEFDGSEYDSYYATDDLLMVTSIHTLKNKKEGSIVVLFNTTNGFNKLAYVVKFSRYRQDKQRYDLSNLINISHDEAIVAVKRIYGARYAKEVTNIWKSNESVVRIHNGKIDREELDGLVHLTTSVRYIYPDTEGPTEGVVEMGNLSTDGFCDTLLYIKKRVLLEIPY